MAKRTPEQSKSFFKRETDKRGDGRELYITPIPVIEQIVSSLIKERPELKEKIWIDPCAGDGRWAEVIKKYGIECSSYDIHPLNKNVKKHDFLNEIKWFPYNKLFFIGNPPFSLLKQFVNMGLLLTDSCYFLGGSQIITGQLADKVDLLHRFEGYEGNQKDKRSKITFIDSNGKDVIVWCCGALFTKKEHNKFNRGENLIDNSFRVGIKTYCNSDERVVLLNKGDKNE